MIVNALMALPNGQVRTWWLCCALLCCAVLRCVAHHRTRLTPAGDQCRLHHNHSRPSRHSNTGFHGIFNRSSNLHGSPMFCFAGHRPRHL